MKLRLGGVGLLLLSGLAAAQTVDDLFDARVVQEFRLQIDPADWAALRDKVPG